MGGETIDAVLRDGGLAPIKDQPRRAPVCLPPHVAVPELPWLGGGVGPHTARLGIEYEAWAASRLWWKRLAD